MAGDGPSSWTVWLVASRPTNKEYVVWGTLPGAYLRTRAYGRPAIPGGKPVELLRELVRDYSRPGDLVLDPYMGAGTTGIACVELGRSFVGVELNAEYFALAEAKILGARYKPGLDFVRARRPKKRRIL
jgi:site-specific DNA-methyltransferase (adenine-specific)